MVSVSHPLSEELPSGLIKFTITFFGMRTLFLLRIVAVAGVVEEEGGVGCDFCRHDAFLDF